MAKHPSSLWPIARTLLLALSAGAASGVIAAVITSQALERYADYLLDRYRAPTVSEAKPSPVPGTFEEALSAVREAAAPSVAVFVAASVDSSIPSAFVDEADALGYGVVISSDGWIATTQLLPSAIAASDAWIDGKRYAVSQVVDDTLTDVRLVKVEATDLSAVGFGAANVMESGEMLFALSADRGVAVTGLEESDALVLHGAQPAEALATTWTLNDALDAAVPLLNASGNLVGFSLDDGAALPLHHALGFLQHTMRGDDAGHAGLGATVVDLSRALNVSAELRQNVTAGALVISSSSATRALVRGGSGAEAGLAEHDIIESVDGELITATQTLAELLATYQAGDTASLNVLRAGELVTVNVTFDDRADLLY